MQDKAKFAFLPLDKLVLDPDVQMREEVDERVVGEYRERIENRDSKDPVFPPLDVFDDGEAQRVADGFHRAIAYKEAGHKTVGCNVHKGGKRDAVLFSVGANAAHGLRRTNATKRRAVETLLRDEEWGKKSNYEIAKKAGVTEFLAREVKKAIYDLIVDAPSTRTVSRNGTTYEMQTGNIGKQPTIDDAPDDDVESVEPAAAASPPSRAVAPPAPEPVRTVTVVNPGGETHADIAADRTERAAIQQESDTDESWVESLPLSKVLKGYCLKVFQEDAAFYRDLGQARKAFGHKAAELLNKCRYIGTYGHETRSFLAKKPPEEWKACPDPAHDGCGATGQTPTGKCGKCFGRGYIKY